MRELHLLWSRAAVGRPHSRRANAARQTGRWPYARWRQTEGPPYSLPPWVAKSAASWRGLSELAGSRRQANSRLRLQRPHLPVRSWLFDSTSSKLRSSPSMAQYQAYPPAPAPRDPGRTLGIVGLILAFFCSLIGLIISIIAYRQSQQAGYKNNIAMAGIIVGAISLVLGLILQFTGVLGGLYGSR